MNWTRWPNFTERELRCPCCARADMDPGFMDDLQALRARMGVPLIVASGYRCPEHNAKVSTTGPNGPHTTGRAVDLAVQGRGAFDLLCKVAFSRFTGIGLRQHGPSRFVHLDTLVPGDHGRDWPRPAIWTYP